MKWEDRREGIFKFLKSEAVAQMWGRKKKNSSMTYEKLSRAMRSVHVQFVLCLGRRTSSVVTLLMGDDTLVLVHIFNGPTGL